MEFQDKVLTCIDCGAEFTFTAGEQLFFHDKQFKNEPKRCKTCKSTPLRSRGNPSHLLPVWQGDHRSLPPYAEPPYLLPRMLHAEENRRLRLTIGEAAGQNQVAIGHDQRACATIVAWIVL